MHDDVVFVVADVLFRAVRWRVLLSPLASVPAGTTMASLLVGMLLSRLETPTANVRLTAMLSLSGSLLYVVGYALWIAWPGGAFLAVLGAALNAISSHWFKLFKEKGLADSYFALATGDASSACNNYGNSIAPTGRC